ncbi:unnamed protein product [Lupinus luteus]|uniref:Uncharacterized protein n=1 Tax=Lupinus luteus TaxID=3873 RepID=A0AAV1XUV9_LUPLU
MEKLKLGAESHVKQPKGKRGKPGEPKNNEQNREGTSIINNNDGERKEKNVVEDIEDSSLSA